MKIYLLRNSLVGSVTDLSVEVGYIAREQAVSVIWL
jgi:hypothetical protein